MENSPILMTASVTKRFGEFTAVSSVDFEMQENESIGIIGPNGAGKTTFLNIITGFYMPDEGKVFSEGRDITYFIPAKRVSRKIVRTFQLVHVFDNLTVYENTALACYREKEGKSLPLGIFSASLRQELIREKVRNSLEMFELDMLVDENVGNLPLGSKKRLELAMALAADPRILVLDEPFAGLGDQEIDEIVKVLKRYTHNKTILVVEHKVSKLTEFADRLAVMHEGKIISYGECDETLNDPEVRRCYWKV
jgi:branched-chain amino acid transport system ATP-binding protein